MNGGPAPAPEAPMALVLSSAGGHGPGSAAPCFAPEHERYVCDRVVDLALAERAGLRSVDGSGAGRLLGRSRSLPCSGLAIRSQHDIAVDGGAP